MAVYKDVSILMYRRGERYLGLKKETQQWLTGTLTDPLAKILMKNSNLTKAQIETFLIDILAEKIAEKRIIYEEKARMRLLRKGVSRGAFNRTLRQARKNVIRSVYTLVLLGYLGVFESPTLEPYIELANKLRTYTEAYRGLWAQGKVEGEHLKVLNMLQKELENGLKQLTEPKNLSERM